MNADFKVNFIVAGTQKGGTTALDEYLREHQSILMSKFKEPHFFDNEDNFACSPNYSIYHQFFKNNQIKKVIGESTPIYMYWYSAPKRIWQYNSNMKFVILLRNPIERAFSHWNMEKNRSIEKLSFFDAILNEEKRMKESLPFQDRNFSYVDRGFYTEQIKRVWHFFPKDQTLILKTDDLKNDFSNTLLKISDFLEVSPFENISPKKAHIANYDDAISLAEFRYLKDVFFYEIKQLEKILGWDCSFWLDETKFI